jgi:hypothetical protein
MKPAWDQLGDEYADSTSVLIGDADCTGSAKDLCEAHEVRGYPTIKYFNSDNPKGADYSGGRDYDALKQFTEENLKASCLLDDDSGCSDKEKDFMAKWKGKGSDDIKKQLERLEGMSGGSMKPDLKKWLNQRKAILKQL